MRKLPLFVLAAATAMSIVGAPMTAHAATFQMAGTGNGMNGYMTNCSGQTGNLASLLNQLGAGANGSGNSSCVPGLNCSGNSECGLGAACSGNSGCGLGAACSGNSGCDFGQSGFGQSGFGQSGSGNQSCSSGQSGSGNQNNAMNGQSLPFMMMR